MQVKQCRMVGTKERKTAGSASQTTQEALTRDWERVLGTFPPPKIEYLVFKVLKFASLFLKRWKPGTVANVTGRAPV